MAEACRACTLVVRSSSADDVVGLVRHQGHTPATEVLVMSVDMNASGLVWVMLLKGFPQRGSVLHHSSGGVLEHAHGGVVDIARSPSWWRCLVYKILWEYKLRYATRGGVVASITPDAPLTGTDPSCCIGPRGSLRVVLK